MHPGGILNLNPVPGLVQCLELLGLLPMQRDGSQFRQLLPRLSSRMVGLGVG